MLSRWPIESLNVHPLPGPTVEDERIAFRSRDFVFALRSSPCEVFPALFDVRLAEEEVRDELIATVVQPDLSVVCDARKIDDRGCRGAPDFVLEILSLSTAARDQITKGGPVREVRSP